MNRYLRAYFYGMIAMFAYRVWLGGLPEIAFVGRMLLQVMSMISLVWFVVERGTVARALAGDEEARRALSGRAPSTPKGRLDADESSDGTTIASSLRSAFSAQSPSEARDQSACSQKSPCPR